MRIFNVAFEGEMLFVAFAGAGKEPVKATLAYKGHDYRVPLLQKFDAFSP